MKKSKKILCVVLALSMLAAVFSVTAGAAAGDTLASYYATNPDGKVGAQGSITIDGSASDWSEDMLVATSAAWDVANHYKGSHEDNLIDAHALFASWDSSNLYIGMQFVNTTDTWQNAGDQSLKDGGKMGETPIMLALSVDPSSTGLTGMLTDGGYIWGNQTAFQTHVDHLFMMSAKPGTGTPAMFTAADSSGNSNYTSACTNFTSAGISYKLADTNICSHIYGLNYSDSASDVYDESADWVDYKTYKGAKGVHNTSYDTFYEMKIPFSALGIDAAYLAENGIGAMILGSRGESTLDCCPFDPEAMLDNVTGSYAQDPSTSHEKDDLDTITVPLARIGADGDVPVNPTTQPATVAPTTQKATTAPATETPAGQLTVNAKSNILTTKTVTASSGDTLIVDYNLTSAMKLVNGEWTLTYDTAKLQLLSVESPNAEALINSKSGKALGAFSSASKLYDFTSGKTLVEATFKVLSAGSTDVTLNVSELSVGYKQNGTLYYRNAVEDGQLKNISSVSGFSSNSISGSAAVTGSSSETLTVNVTSNLFGTVSKTVTTDAGKVIVEIPLTCDTKLLNAQWAVTYDTSKLSFDKNHLDSLMPNVHTFSALEQTKGTIKGNFSNLRGEDFKTQKDFVRIFFDIVESGTANVNFDCKILGVRENGVEAYPVFNSTEQETGSSFSGSAEIDSFPADTISGDVNLDGVVDVNDVTLVQKYIAEYDITFTGAQQLVADMNGDGNVTIVDATYIQYSIAGMLN